MKILYLQCSVAVEQLSQILRDEPESICVEYSFLITEITLNANKNEENLKKDLKSGGENKKKTLRNCKELQWRLVASKEGIKMRESLLRESSQKNLPQMSRAQGISM